jgi:hypothetical protein
MRKGYVAAIAIAAALWVVPSAAAETVTIGAASPAPTTGGGCSQCRGLQLSTAPSSPGYVVPAAAPGGPWTMTSWTTMGGETAGTGAIEVWRPTATTGQYQLIAVGPDQSVPAGASVTLPVNIPVQPGDHIGVHSGDSPSGWDYVYTAADEDLLGRVTFAAAIGQTAGPGGDFPITEQTNYRVNAAATLTAPDLPVQKKKKCKRKKHKRSAESAKKKKCKKKKKGK